MSDIEAIEKAIEIQSSEIKMQSVDIKSLTEKVGLLATAVTEKTVRDEYLIKEVETLRFELKENNDKVESVKSDLSDVQTVLAVKKNESMWANKFLTPLITVAMVAVGGAIIWAIVGSKS